MQYQILLLDDTIEEGEIPPSAFFDDKIAVNIAREKKVGVMFDRTFCLTSKSCCSFGQHPDVNLFLFLFLFSFYLFISLDVQSHLADIHN